MRLARKLTRCERRAGTVACPRVPSLQLAAHRSDRTRGELGRLAPSDRCPPRHMDDPVFPGFGLPCRMTGSTHESNGPPAVPRSCARHLLRCSEFVATRRDGRDWRLHALLNIVAHRPTWIPPPPSRPRIPSPLPNIHQCHLPFRPARTSILRRRGLFFRLGTTASVTSGSIASTSPASSSSRATVCRVAEARPLRFCSR